MMLKLPKKGPLLWLYAGGALLLLAAATVWCFRTTTNPENVFWGTIERSLSTSGVTVQSEQTNGGTNVQQIIRYSFGADNRSHSLTTLSQGNTTVVNEMIGTPSADYTRYVSVKTDQKRADGMPIDPSKILGVWAVNQGGASQFFTQAVFGASLPVGGMGVPMANLSPEARAKLVAQIQNDSVYQISFDKIEKERVNGRRQYTYEATIQPFAYVKMVKQFASDLGLHGLDQLDPAGYKGQKPFHLRIVVDVRARQVVRITASDTDNTQTYASYDVPVQIEIPKKTITGAELQQRLSNLQ